MAYLLSAWFAKIKIVVGLLVLSVIKRLRWSSVHGKNEDKEPDYQDGIVYIHMFPRCFTKKVVNLSPYAVKVETWCRMNKVPYRVVETMKFSPKEKHIPWIVYNGAIYADSSVIIDLLGKAFNRHDDLSDVDKGTSWTINRMMDENFALLYFLYRYHIKQEEFSKYFRPTTAPRFLQKFILERIGKGIKQRCMLNGFARYGEDHVVALGNKDIDALDSVLGNKPYMFGDRPTAVDATVFAHLSQVLYPDLFYPWKDYIKQEHPRLLDYCNRIKERYWPDWDSLVEHDTFQ